MVRVELVSLWFSDVCEFGRVGKAEKAVVGKAADVGRLVMLCVDKLVEVLVG